MQLRNISSQTKKIDWRKILSYHQQFNLWLPSYFWRYFFWIYINYIQYIPKEYDKQFRHYINLPSELIIKEDAKAMFHKLFNEELSNRSISIITKLIDKNHIEVAFSINSGINQIIVEKITAYFNFDGAPAELNFHFKMHFH